MSFLKNRLQAAPRESMICNNNDFVCTVYVRYGTYCLVVSSLKPEALINSWKMGPWTVQSSLEATVAISQNMKLGQPRLRHLVLNYNVQYAQLSA